MSSKADIPKAENVALTDGQSVYETYAALMSREGPGSAAVHAPDGAVWDIRWGSKAAWPNPFDSTPT